MRRGAVLTILSEEYEAITGRPVGGNDRAVVYRTADALLNLSVNHSANQGAHHRPSSTRPGRGMINQRKVSTVTTTHPTTEVPQVDADGYLIDPDLPDRKIRLFTPMSGPENTVFLGPAATDVTLYPAIAKAVATGRVHLLVGDMNESLRAVSGISPWSYAATAEEVYRQLKRVYAGILARSRHLKDYAWRDQDGDLTIGMPFFDQDVMSSQVEEETLPDEPDVYPIDWPIVLYVLHGAGKAFNDAVWGKKIVDLVDRCLRMGRKTGVAFWVSAVSESDIRYTGSTTLHQMLLGGTVISTEPGGKHAVAAYRNAWLRKTCMIQMLDRLTIDAFFNAAKEWEDVEPVDTARTTEPAAAPTTAVTVRVSDLKRAIDAVDGFGTDLDRVWQHDPDDDLDWVLLYIRAGYISLVLGDDEAVATAQVTRTDTGTDEHDLIIDRDDLRAVAKFINKMGYTSSAPLVAITVGKTNLTIESVDSFKVTLPTEPAEVPVDEVYVPRRRPPLVVVAGVVAGTVAGAALAVAACAAIRAFTGRRARS